MHIQTPDFLQEMLANARLPLSQRLIKKAEAAEAEARGLENCMWMGDRHPAEGPREEARLLREAALVAAQQEAREAKRKSA